MKADRDVVIGLLVKLDAPYSPDITPERAVKKLHRYAKKFGLPESLTDEERDVLSHLGFNVAAAEPPTPRDPGLPPVDSSPEPSEKRDKRVHWMEIAVLALKRTDTIEEAERAAVDLYVEMNGKRAKNIVSNAKLYVSRAVIALTAAGIAALAEDKKQLKFHAFQLLTADEG